MPEPKQPRREPEPEPKSEPASTAAPKTPRRERQYWTADTDNPLICRGID